MGIPCRNYFPNTYTSVTNKRKINLAKSLWCNTCSKTLHITKRKLLFRRNRNLANQQTILRNINELTTFLALALSSYGVANNLSIDEARHKCKSVSNATSPGYKIRFTLEDLIVIANLDGRF